jgi:hypothetical protein
LLPFAASFTTRSSVERYSRYRFRPSGVMRQMVCGRLRSWPFTISTIPSVSRTRRCRLRFPSVSEQSLKVLELGDGTLMACAELGDMPVQGPPGSRILPGGLNVPAVIEALRSVGFPDQPTGAAYLRYSEELRCSAFQRPLGLLGICGGTVVAASSPSRGLARRVSRDARLDDSRARCRDEAARSGGCKLITGDIRRLSSKQGDCCSSDC